MLFCQQFARDPQRPKICASLVKINGAQNMVSNCPATASKGILISRSPNQTFCNFWSLKTRLVLLNYVEFGVYNNVSFR